MVRQPSSKASEQAPTKDLQHATLQLLQREPSKDLQRVSSASTDSRKMPSTGLILLMGVTGTGKSYFVNTLEAGSTVVGDGLQSCTTKMERIDIKIGGTLITLLDCPGFDDSSRSDVDILHEIALPMALQYKAGQELIGAIWLHSVVDVRMRGSTTQAFEVFQQIVGDKACKNVLLVTTQWGRAVTDEEKRKAEEREDSLRDEYWAPMLRKGAQMNRFNGTSSSAEALISQLLGMRASKVVFQVQKELVDEEKTLRDTGAGARLGPEVEKNIARHKAKVDELEVAIKASRLPAVQKKRINLEKEEAKAKLGRNRADEQILKSEPGKWLMKLFRKKKVKKILSNALSIGNMVFAVAGFFRLDPNDDESDGSSRSDRHSRRPGHHLSSVEHLSRVSEYHSDSSEHDFGATDDYSASDEERDSSCGRKTRKHHKGRK